MQAFESLRVLLKEISVSDLTEGAVDALYSLHAKRDSIDQLRDLFHQRLTSRSIQGVDASATVLPLFVEKKPMILLFDTCIFGALSAGSAELYRL